MQKKKILIVYHRGNYGSFINWVLSNANNKLTDQLPFGKTGNMHNLNFIYTVFPLTGYDDIVDFLKSDVQIAQCHPTDSTVGTDLIIRLSRKYLSNLKIILIDHNYDSYIWIANNIFEKTSSDWIRSNCQHLIDFLRMWGEKNSINEYEHWQIREALSCYLEGPQWGEYGLDGLFNNANGHDLGFYFDIKHLRDNFKETIINLCNYCEMPYNQDTIDLIDVQWHKTQKNLYKDKLVNDVVYKILNNIDFTITESLTLIDEAFIQQKLNNAGAKLRCYNLNTFPKTNKEFQDLIYYNFNTLLENNVNDVLTRVYNKQITKETAINEFSRIVNKLHD